MVIIDFDNSFEVAVSIRRLGLNKIPPLVMISYLDNNKEVRENNNIFDGFIAKPIKQSELK